MPETQVEAYYEFLSDIPLDALKQAALRAVQESETGFIPTVATLRRLASEAQWGSLPGWGEEWERVMVCVRRFGLSQSDKALQALGLFTWRVVGQVGWSAICNSEMINVQMSQFRDLYIAASEAEIRRRCLSEELRPARSSKFLTQQVVRRLEVNANGNN